MTKEPLEITRRSKIVVVVPAYNEERNIGMVIETMPDFVEQIVVVDDCSSDSTPTIVSEYARRDARVLLIRHEQNQGPGGAMATGYKWARKNQADVVALMAGDGQTAPEDLAAIVDPILRGRVDYAKGNRLLHADAAVKIPKPRFLGNAVLSLLTKIASGYWQVIIPSQVSRL